MPNRRRKVTKSSTKSKTTNNRYLDKKVKFVIKDNPRRAGTAVAKRFGSGMSYLRRKPNATAREVYAKTSFQSADLGYAIKKRWAKVA